VFYVTARFYVDQIPSRSPKDAGARVTQVLQTVYVVTTTHSSLENLARLKMQKGKALSFIQRLHWELFSTGVTHRSNWEAAAGAKWIICLWTQKHYILFSLCTQSPHPS